MERRMRDMNCVDVTPPESPLADSRSSHRYLARPESDSGALSDSELPWRQHYYKDANSNHTKVFHFSSCFNSNSAYYCTNYRLTFLYFVIFFMYI